jgi:hypothetical protein
MKKTHHHLKHKHVEHQLLPRLQMLGWLLILFGCGTFTYSFMVAKDEDQDTPLAEALEIEEVESSGPSLLPVPKLKLEIIYLGVSSFWIIGTACVIFAWRRKKRLSE